MNSNIRLIATLIVWVVLAAILGIMLTSPTGAVSEASGDVIFGVVAVLAAAASISTLAIWFGVRDTPQPQSHLAKGKRGDQRQTVRQILNTLEDDEVYELESLLLAQEDEARQQSAHSAGPHDRA
ncbi:MAG: hypothetical protein GXY36_11810 [Chloroflexi bacterium]|nr:hypothetical protein [Chloroflexota bacterium]